MFLTLSILALPSRHVGVAGMAFATGRANMAAINDGAPPGVPVS